MSLIGVILIPLAPGRWRSRSLLVAAGRCWSLLVAGRRSAEEASGVRHRTRPSQVRGLCWSPLGESEDLQPATLCVRLVAIVCSHVRAFTPTRSRQRENRQFQNRHAVPAQTRFPLFDSCMHHAHPAFALHRQKARSKRSLTRAVRRLSRVGGAGHLSSEPHSGVRARTRRLSARLREDGRNEKPVVQVRPAPHSARW